MTDQPHEAETWPAVERRHPDVWEARLVRLEVTLKHINQNIASATDIHAATIRELRDELKNMRPQIGAISKIVFAAAGVLLVIVGMVGKVAVYDPYVEIKTRFEKELKDAKEERGYIRNQHYDHTKDGHPNVVLRELGLTRDSINEQLRGIRHTLEKHDVDEAVRNQSPASSRP